MKNPFNIYMNKRKLYVDVARDVNTAFWDIHKAFDVVADPLSGLRIGSVFEGPFRRDLTIARGTIDYNLACEQLFKNQEGQERAVEASESLGKLHRILLGLTPLSFRFSGLAYKFPTKEISKIYDENSGLEEKEVTKSVISKIKQGLYEYAKDTYNVLDKYVKAQIKGSPEEISSKERETKFKQLYENGISKLDNAIALLS